MSVILEALRKSEQQRKQEESFKSLLPPIPQNKPHTSNRSLLIAYTLVVLLSALLITNWLTQNSSIQFENWFNGRFFKDFQIRASSAVPQTERQEQSKTVAAKPNAELVSPVKEDKPAPPTRPVTPASPAATTRPSAAILVGKTPPPPITSSKPAQPVAIRELPPEIQRQIPSLNYASHWFDKAAQKSTVLINNISLKEGARIGNGIIVKSITSTGTVFHLDGWLFYLPMLESWPGTD